HVHAHPIRHRDVIVHRARDEDLQRDIAAEERFKAEAPHYRVLHVAGHGILNDASPMHSYLLLAPGGAKEDGYLEAGELMQMDLGAELVVLSACDTARGTYAAGEGIIGFSWALFAALPHAGREPVESRFVGHERAHARLPPERAQRPHQSRQRPAEDDRVDAEDETVPASVLL